MCACPPNELPLPTQASELVELDSQAERLKLFLSLEPGRPILVEGPVGCGRTALVNAVVSNADNRLNPIWISMDQTAQNMDKIFARMSPVDMATRCKNVLILDHFDLRKKDGSLIKAKACKSSTTKMSATPSTKQGFPYTEFIQELLVRQGVIGREQARAQKIHKAKPVAARGPLKPKSNAKSTDRELSTIKPVLVILIVTKSDDLPAGYLDGGRRKTNVIPMCAPSDLRMQRLLQRWMDLHSDEFLDLKTLAPQLLETAKHYTNIWDMLSCAYQTALFGKMHHREADTKRFVHKDVMTVLNRRSKNGGDVDLRWRIASKNDSYLVDAILTNHMGTLPAALLKSTNFLDVMTHVSDTADLLSGVNLLQNPSDMALRVDSSYMARVRYLATFAHVPPGCPLARVQTMYSVRRPSPWLSNACMSFDVGIDDALGFRSLSDVDKRLTAEVWVSCARALGMKKSSRSPHVMEQAAKRDPLEQYRKRKADEMEFVSIDWMMGEAETDAAHARRRKTNAL